MQRCKDGRQTLAFRSFWGTIFMSLESYRPIEVTSLDTRDSDYWKARYCHWNGLWPLLPAMTSK